MEIPNRIIVPPLQGIKGKDMIQLANREGSRNEGSWREFKLIESALELMKVARWQHGKVNARVRLRRGCMWVNEIALEMLKAHKTPWHILSKNTGVVETFVPWSRRNHGVITGKLWSEIITPWLMTVITPHITVAWSRPELWWQRFDHGQDQRIIKFNDHVDNAKFNN